MALQFEKKKKRNSALTVRLPEETIEKLRRLAKHYGVSQADIVEKMIDDSPLPKVKAK